MPEKIVLCWNGAQLPFQWYKFFCVSTLLLHASWLDHLICDTNTTHEGTMCSTPKSQRSRLHGLFENLLCGSAPIWPIRVLWTNTIHEEKVCHVPLPGQICCTSFPKDQRSMPHGLFEVFFCPLRSSMPIWLMQFICVQMQPMRWICMVHHFRVKRSRSHRSFEVFTMSTLWLCFYSFHMGHKYNLWDDVSCNTSRSKWSKLKVTQVVHIKNVGLWRLRSATAIRSPDLLVILSSCIIEIDYSSVFCEKGSLHCRNVEQLVWGSCTEAHKGHHCKYFFRKVFFISARFFFISARFFFISTRLVYFRMVICISARSNCISADIYINLLLPQGLFDFRKVILLPQGLFYFRKVNLISAKIFSMVTTRVLVGPGHLA